MDSVLADVVTLVPWTMNPRVGHVTAKGDYRARDLVSIIVVIVVTSGATLQIDVRVVTVRRHGDIDLVLRADP